VTIAETLLPEFDQEMATTVDVPVPSIYGPTADEQMPGF
jgi:hypothetical protein